MSFFFSITFQCQGCSFDKLQHWSRNGSTVRTLSYLCFPSFYYGLWRYIFCSATLHFTVIHNVIMSGQLNHKRHVVLVVITEGMFTALFFFFFLVYDLVPHSLFCTLRDKHCIPTVITSAMVTALHQRMHPSYVSTRPIHFDKANSQHKDHIKMNPPRMTMWCHCEARIKKGAFVFLRLEMHCRAINIG